MSKNDVTVRVTPKDGDLAVPDEVASLFAANAGAGTQSVQMTDMQLPVLKQVQDISAERDPDAPEYINGAETGDFFNSVTRQVYKGALVIIPTNIRKTVVAFTARAQGGGFLGEFATKEEALEYLDAPAELKETVELSLLYRPEGGDEDWKPALLNMSDSKLKPGRTLMTMLVSLRVPIRGESIQPPCYGTVFRLASTRIKGPKGTYRNISFNFLQLVDDASLFERAKIFGEVMAARELRSGFDDAADATGTPADDDDKNPSY